MRAKIFDLVMNGVVIVFFVCAIVRYGVLVALGFFLIGGAAVITLYSYARGFFGGAPHAHKLDAQE